MEITVILCGLAAMFVWYAASGWLTLGKRNGSDFPAATFKRVAISTALALFLMGGVLAWVALLALR